MSCRARLAFAAAVVAALTPLAAQQRQPPLVLSQLTWFDRVGNFHSEALHVVERYTMTGPDHIAYEATIEDPKVFTRPWKMNMIFYRHKEPGFQLLDYECYAFGDEDTSSTARWVQP